MNNNQKLISLTGDRPTGPLHIGHLVGSLLKRVEIQDTHHSFIMIADSQAYSDHIMNREKVSNSIFQVLSDYLSVGIDPQKTTIFLQSAVPEIQELSFYFNQLITVSRLERIPTVRKEIFQKFTSPDVYNLEIPRNIPVGFLTYAVSQSADILSFNADIAPVGRDQLPIIELTNEIALIFNKITGTKTFKKCEGVIGSEGTLLGIDGKSKMSKTLGNTINLNSNNDEISKKVKKMYTDKNHLNVSDPGEISGNMVFSYLDVFYSDKGHLEELKEHYKRGGLGDMTVKNILIETLIEYFNPIQKRRNEIDQSTLIDILKSGTDIARSVASKKVSEAKKALGLMLF
jgi:tryptophanyl-tRNA synthetase